MVGASDDRPAGERRRRRRDERRRASRGAPSTQARPLIGEPVPVPEPEPEPEPEPDSRRNQGADPQPASTGDIQPLDHTGSHSAPAATSVVPSGRRGRSRVRPKAVILVVVAMLLTALAVGAVTTGLIGSQRADQGIPDATAPVAAQETVFLAVTASGRDVIVGSLLAVDDRRAVSLLVPGQLLLDVPGAGRSPLAESLTIGDAAPGQAVADALDVRVDGTWVLTLNGLAQLVDSLGGVMVDVDHEVAVGDVLLPVGDAQRLDGAQAAAFASYAGEGEAEQVRLARFDQVLNGVLRQLPTDPTTLASQLAELGASSRSTLAPEQLAETLTQPGPGGRTPTSWTPRCCR